ncbi:aminotransferase class IV [Sphingobacterium griseoflavum]|uniref:branched-chain-amino-acid transaminase n=1 Tax=Sphingobacterium griseoflavum TaxID=1474952 RepID=A0ABQ3HTK6_9SPHI|nr:aminotransferase class IV [Sphingobacterium griseoflavum]GHE32580.1 branched chain amino acid aminotransferase [Sphingobacterium griseoflavum]
MSIQYINFDGQIIAESQHIANIDSRALRYGDGLFETMLWKDGDIRFLKRHIDRLQQGMQTLQLEESTKFDEFFLRSKTEELIRKNNMLGQQARVRLTVFRAGGGLYSPDTNKPMYCLQVSRIATSLRDKKLGLIVDLYTEFKKPYSDLSHLKSNNALIYVMAGLYKKKFAYDEVFILNQEGYLCEALTSNIFVYYEKVLYTPAITEGCVAGVMRSVMMDIAKSENIQVVEAQISPEIMKQADEIFCTNAVQGVQWVMGYKQKRYFNKISRIMQDKLQHWPDGEQD